MDKKYVVIATKDGVCIKTLFFNSKKKIVKYIADSAYMPLTYKIYKLTETITDTTIIEE